MIDQSIALAFGFLITAGLYSAVGHAGASAYLALMAISNVLPETMKPVALILNCMVALIGTWRYRHHLDKKLITTLLIASAPMAFIGGQIHLSKIYYELLLAFGLIFASWRMLSPISSAKISEHNIKKGSLFYLLTVGGSIGLLSGLTGIGGGIFLSPVLLLMHWATVRTTSATSSAFILVNSIAGLIGFLTTHSHVQLPEAMPFWLLAVIIGSTIGTKWGLKSPPSYVVKLLGLLLGIAGLKLVL